MTKQEAQAAYAAYAELEAAAEAFYTAAHKMAAIVSKTEANALYELCDEVSVQMAILDCELDEVL